MLQPGGTDVVENDLRFIGVCPLAGGDINSVFAAQVSASALVRKPLFVRFCRRGCGIGRARRALFLFGI